MSQGQAASCGPGATPTGTAGGAMFPPLVALKYLCDAAGDLAATHFGLTWSTRHVQKGERGSYEVVRKDKTKKKQPYLKITTTKK